MTNAPTDLLAFRAGVRTRTGLGAVEVGIVGDGVHARTGGYHEGKDVLVSIGRYHAPPDQHVGSSVEDYSARKLRDRTGLTDDASAVDIGDDWPRGGRAAWLRFNNALVAALHAGDPALAPVRAVNYSPDGTARKRTDREHGWAVEDSTDSVNIHTHLEWYRNTAGRRAACLARLLELIDAAIAPPTVGSTQMEQADRLVFQTNSPGRAVGQAISDGANLRDWWVGSGQVVPGDASWPLPDSPAGKLKAFLDNPPAITLSPEDRAAMVADVAAQVTTALAPGIQAAVTAAVADLRARMAAGAQAEHDALSG